MASLGHNELMMLDLIAFQSEEDGVVLACMRALHQIFGHLLREKEMYFNQPPTDEQDLKGESVACLNKTLKFFSIFT